MDQGEVTKEKIPARMESRERTLPRPIMPHWSDHRAWLFSCILHTTLFVSLAVFWKPVTRGTGSEEDRPVGIAIAHKTNSGTEYFVSGGGSSASAATDTNATPSTALSSIPGAVPLEELLSELLPSDASSSASTQGANSVGTGLSGTGTSGIAGTGNGDFGTGKKTKSTFFGVEGIGTSFVYVLDRSDSMNTNSGAPMAVAKKELLKSLESLEEDNQFQIIFYNESPIPLASMKGITNRMMFAKEQDRNRAKQFVRSMVANGGTEHMAALRAGLAFGPEVLFFLTDADDPRLTESQLTDLRDRAGRTGTTIHTVQFRAGPQQGEGGWIRTLAEMTKGTYRYVNVDEFRPE